MGFWDAFKRWKLAQKGLSSGKKRRVYDADDNWIAVLNNSPWLSWLLSMSFLLGMLIIIVPGFPAEIPQWKPFSTAAVLACTALLMLKAGHKSSHGGNSELLLLLGGVLLHLFVLRLIASWVDSSAQDTTYKLLLAPFALAPMVHSVLLGRRAGTFSAVFVSISGCLLMPSEEVVSYLVISLVCGMTAALLTYKVRRRAEILRAGIITGALALILALVFGLLVNAQSADLSLWQRITPAMSAFAVGFVTALLVSGCLPLLEGAFAMTTNISWLELGDLNHPLLKRMQLDAPGTFHHSLVVASLAEAAAESIGANAAMCRACAYFHDVGKLKKPEYFIENQATDSENPHDALTPTMSALVIIAHVKDGVDLALKHKLNHHIIDAILEHHGDTMVYSFYRKAQELRLSEEEKVGKGLGNSEDLPQVDENNFRYPGPRPRSKETGILSLADAVESASRSLKKTTPVKIRSLVDEIVKARWSDGQLDDCPLTMRDLTKIRESFAHTLRSMLHSRISYTKVEDGNESKKNRSDSSLGRDPRSEATKEP